MVQIQALLLHQNSPCQCHHHPTQILPPDQQLPCPSPFPLPPPSFSLPGPYPLMDSDPQMRSHSPTHHVLATSPERMEIYIRKLENYIRNPAMITCQVSWTNHDQLLCQLELSSVDFVCFMLNLNAVCHNLCHISGSDTKSGYISGTMTNSRPNFFV